MNDVVRVLKAAEFAASKHSKQRRKGEEAEPYVNHLIEVARLVAEATDGRADMVVAGLLHDTVEDQAVKFDEIVALFGSRVPPWWRRSPDINRSCQSESSSERMPLTYSFRLLRVVFR
jgi:(p)ppGpp synthase/HD superfamily hydrolase